MRESTDLVHLGELLLAGLEYLEDRQEAIDAELEAVETMLTEKLGIDVTVLLDAVAEVKAARDVEQAILRGEERPLTARARAEYVRETAQARHDRFRTGVLRPLAARLAVLRAESDPAGPTPS